MKIILPIGTTWQDYPDNESLSLLVYTVGCSFNCKNCHNKRLGEKDYVELTGSSFFELLRVESSKQKTNKVVIEGGDPLYEGNIQGIKEFLEINRKENFFDVCLYTGNEINNVKELGIYGFSFIKCGKYIEELKNKSYKNDNEIVFSSKNQKLYDPNYNLLSTDNYYKFIN